MAGNLHVLIAGISAYRNLPGPTDPMPATAMGMRQLSSPALSAYSLYRWIQENRNSLSLASCELLLSPSQAELIADQQLAAVHAAGTSKPCTLANFLQAASVWRQNAAVSADDITWFYFAGHGVQRSKNDAILCLEEFGQNGGGALINAVDLNTLFNGMAPSPSFPNIARTQFYFIDACRMLPEEFKKIETQNPTQVYQVELSGRDDRRAPIFFATISGAAAAGFRAKKSVFSEILLRCLDGSAGEPVQNDAGEVDWHVTSNAVASAMKMMFGDWNDVGLDQHFTISGLTQGNAHLRKLSGPPNVDVYIDIDPELARHLATISISNAADLQPVALPQNPPGPPYQVRWSAGAYRVQVQVPPHPQFVSPPASIRTVLPPRCRLIGKVTP